MRILLTRLDQLRTTVFKELAGFCDALVSTLLDIQAATQAWAERDHNSDGTHNVIRLSEQSAVPSATALRLTLFYDGTDLKVVRPDGTTGTVTIV